jgi:hypothetical protein
MAGGLALIAAGAALLTGISRSGGFVSAVLPSEVPRSTASAPRSPPTWR